MYNAADDEDCHNQAEHEAFFHLMLQVIDRPQAEITPQMLAEAAALWTATHGEPAHVIDYGTSSHIERGRIQDGGGDMYDGGNQIFTTRCPDDSGPLRPYTNGMTPGPESGAYSPTCFPDGTSIQMNMGDHLFSFATTYSSSDNTVDPSSFDIWVDGNLGADGSGQHAQHTFVGRPGGYNIETAFPATCVGTDPTGSACAVNSAGTACAVEIGCTFLSVDTATGLSWPYTGSTSGPIYTGHHSTACETHDPHVNDLYQTTLICLCGILLACLSPLTLPPSGTRALQVPEYLELQAHICVFGFLNQEVPHYRLTSAVVDVSFTTS